ncbi:O-antigen polysaccharide polymerase Wzy [Rubrobacter radiotolerans]|uniref:O-antigen polysaccharide polymerase Wzy n=1 Tax=Rubrobacter radiotolerans TaxID=42256 RepID=A0A023X3S3_RUBRA|nr:O-antigen polysaccharide polymerase Wzy [Rubrobacter radiotolerans]AHY47008.1 O-antigen polysaccharide polymerase Wzy [Rubrobacter radiotolerans]MDX5894414.1 O-antigen polysaccharide polymerase Wzy [Rubrobacter radiotolerans]SMC05948.1 oligosaccharide repeat unit polymerase [Rubrobacter radiotolerans DSM 5868]
MVSVPQSSRARLGLPEPSTGAAEGRIGARWGFAFLGNLALLVLLALLAVAYNVFEFGSSPSSLLRPACLLLLLCCVWTLLSWRLASGSIFNLYGFFLISAALFNGGQAFLYLFGVDTARLARSVAVSVPDVFSPETVLLTVYLVSVSLIGFHTGGLLSIPVTARRKAVPPAEEAQASNDATTALSLRLVGWGLLAVSVFPMIYLLGQMTTVVLRSNYMNIYQQDFGSAVSILAAAIVPAAIFLLAGSRGMKFNILLSALIVIAYSLIQFFLGNRAGAAMFLVAYAWTFHRAVRPIPNLALFAVGAFMLFVVFPVIRIFRDTGGSQNFSFETLSDTFASIDNPVVSILHEMGFSMITVAHTIELVPGFRNYDYGVSYFYGALGMFPSLFAENHPTAVHGTLNRWLALAVEPNLASTFPNWSLGFSFIAEAYLNFGWIGAPIILAVMGFLLGWFVLAAERSGDLARIATVGAFTGFFLIFARAESNDVLRSLLWYAVFPYLAVLFTRTWILRSRHLARRRDPLVGRRIPGER